jgi:hypothetical protein
MLKLFITISSFSCPLCKTFLYGKLLKVISNSLEMENWKLTELSKIFNIIVKNYNCFNIKKLWIISLRPEVSLFVLSPEIEDRDAVVARLGEFMWS